MAPHAHGGSQVAVAWLSHSGWRTAHLLLALHPFQLCVCRGAVRHPPLPQSLRELRLSLLLRLHRLAAPHAPQHAIGAAHNLLSAMIDNHLYWENELRLDSRRVSWRRVVDINDRALRDITVGLGGVANGFARETGYDITVASEIMAIFCLANSLSDLERRLGNIVVGQTRKREAITAKQLEADGAMAVLLKDALMPNLVQTLENNPAFVHGGPFANIAHGCNTVMATEAALRLSDYVVTEAGFGADLGAEKFFDIKCRKAGLKPDAAVIVATIRCQFGSSVLRPARTRAMAHGVSRCQRLGAPSLRRATPPAYFFGFSQGRVLNATLNLVLNFADIAA